jgi:hypothetical protein
MMLVNGGSQRKNLPSFHAISWALMASLEKNAEPCRSRCPPFVALPNPRPGVPDAVSDADQIANDTDYEAGKPPPAELDAAMGELIGEWSKTGAMVSAAGLKPTSQAARVRLTGDGVSVSDGPFMEAKEVIGGFFLLEAPDKRAAVEMTRKFVQLHGEVLGKNFVLECEVRQVEA